MPKPVNKLLLCGGGSGGHLQPAIAIATEFLTNQNNKQVLFVVSKSALDKAILTSIGFNFTTIYTGKLRRYWSLSNFTDFFKFFYGIGQAYFIIKKFKPDAIFSKGGFIALPVALAGFFLKIPVIAHESDIVPGLANKIIANFATKICSTFNVNNNKNTKIYYTGTPLRSQIFSAKNQAHLGQSFLAFKQNELPIVLFMGASQGALQINQICQFILSVKKTHHLAFNMVLIAGKNKLIQQIDDNFREYEYLDTEFFPILARADLVISRAGANSLFELAYLGKASIIIPLASSANNHQYENANFFAKAKAIELINPYLDQEALNLLVIQKIEYYLQNSIAKQKLSDNIKKLSLNNASQKIVQIINQ